MTVQEMLTQGFQLAGEPSDLCPFTTPGDPTTFAWGSAGTAPLLGWLNNAYVRIANWKYPDGAILRFRNLKKSLFFKTLAAKTGSVLSGTADTVNIDAFNPLNRVDQFTGWILAVTSATGVIQQRIVVSTTGTLAANSVLRVHQDWTTIPDAAYTYSLYKRFFELVASPIAGSVDDYMVAADPVNRVADIMKIRDLLTVVDLAQRPRTEAFTATMMMPGLPTAWSFDGNRIVFDVPFSAVRSFEALYYAHPALITAQTDVVDVAAPFQQAIVQWMVHALQMRAQDFNGAYATKRDLQEFMQTIRHSGEMQSEMNDSGLVIYG